MSPFNLIAVNDEKTIEILMSTVTQGRVFIAHVTLLLIRYALAFYYQLCLKCHSLR